jgi:type I restriction-modification system DNA methylase subunit
MDPACGSGIFLVEAFRRIVRYEWHKNKQPLTFDELKGILKKQIAGIEVNAEAARITAFSLYLSMLHYLDPPAIDKQMKMGNRLPNLVATTNRSANNFHCILPGNAFDIDHIESNPIWKARFGVECADVVVGNPPWGAPGTKADAETKARQKILLDWCKSSNKPIGDKEPSQAFLWRALDFLKQNGKAGMLVSAGVFFKHNTTTKTFRKQWLDCVRLKEVFNFVHVRKFFFKGADSPFVSICFSKAKQKDMPVYYWTAKQSTSFNKNQSILLSRHDLNIISDHDLADYKTWKSLWWGRFIDKQFLDYLNIFPKLSSCIDIDNSARGFQEGNRKSMADWRGKYQELPINKINRYAQFSDKWLVSAPDYVESRGKTESLYSGDRILVKRGVEQKNSPKGQIISHFYKETFCFRNSAHCIKLINSNQDAYKLLIGILWSSVARYFYFLTSSNWGLWHYEIHLEEIFAFPVKLNESNNKNKKKVISIVDKLRKYHPQELDIHHPNGTSEEEINAQRRKWETELDEAVFELYGLNEEQKDLIRDLCEVTLPFFYKPFDSIGAMQAVEKNDLSWIEKYVHIFCRRWNAYLGDGEEMRAKVHLGAHDNMVAVEFFPADKGDPWNLKSKNDSWGYILEQLGNTLPQPMGTSQIVLDGLVHVVSDSGIIIIKRNEKRFWTRSLAREDADATICKRMVDTMPKERRSR